MLARFFTDTDSSLDSVDKRVCFSQKLRMLDTFFPAFKVLSRGSEGPVSIWLLAFCAWQVRGVGMVDIACSEGGMFSSLALGALPLEAPMARDEAPPAAAAPTVAPAP